VYVIYVIVDFPSEHSILLTSKQATSPNPQPVKSSWVHTNKFSINHYCTGIGDLNPHTESQLEDLAQSVG
jgi:hypothetical protein